MTKLIRHDPFRHLLTWPRWIDGWEDTFSTQRGLKVHETENAIIAEAIVAGVPTKDVDIRIDDGILTIKAEAKEEEKEKNLYRSSSYKYYYTCALSGGLWNKAKAEVEDGVVTITIPKTPSSEPRKIKVKAREKK